MRDSRNSKNDAVESHVRDISGYGFLEQIKEGENMIRGTTPTLKFTLPFDVEQLTTAWLTFSQNNQVVINKTLSDCTYSGKVITLVLTQTDTLALDSKYRVEIQIRGKTTDGKAIASAVFTDSVDRILKDGEI